MSPRDPGLRDAMLGAVGLGVLAALGFLSFHALLVQPIWVKAAPRAVVMAVLGGLLVGHTFYRVRGLLPSTGASQGAVYGFMLAAVFLPSVVAGHLAALGESMIVRVGVLLIGHIFVFLLYGHVFAAIHHGAFQREAWVRMYLTAWVVNGFPAFFLFFLDQFVIEGAPGNPYPMSFVLLGLYVAAGTTLGAWLGRRHPLARGGRVGRGVAWLHAPDAR